MGAGGSSPVRDSTRAAARLVVHQALFCGVVDVVLFEAFDRFGVHLAGVGEEVVDLFPDGSGGHGGTPAAVGTYLTTSGLAAG